MEESTARDTMLGESSDSSSCRGVDLGSGAGASGVLFGFFFGCSSAGSALAPFSRSQSNSPLSSQTPEQFEHLSTAGKEAPAGGFLMIRVHRNLESISPQSFLLAVNF